MYHLIRRIHLYANLVLVLFLMMYFVSGYMMIHTGWFSTSNHPEPVQTAALESSANRPVEKVAVDVKKQLHMVGRIVFPTTQPPGMTRFWITHPGTITRVDIVASENLMRIYTVREGFIGVLIMLHKICGYDDKALYNFCTLFCDLSGLAMIVFALSGVYLWWKRTKHHFWGIVCLTSSCVYAAGVMLYLAFAP
jgi:hypothetical protein